MLKMEWTSLTEIRKQKEHLERILTQLRTYKEEYEHLNDWLLQMDADMKAYKTILLSSLQEKHDQLERVRVRSHEI